MGPSGVGLLARAAWPQPERRRGGGAAARAGCSLQASGAEDWRLAAAGGDGAVLQRRRCGWGSELEQEVGTGLRVWGWGNKFHLGQLNGLIGHFPCFYLSPRFSLSRRRTPPRRRSSMTADSPEGEMIGVGSVVLPQQ